MAATVAAARAAKAARATGGRRGAGVPGGGEVLEAGEAPPPPPETPPPPNLLVSGKRTMAAGRRFSFIPGNQLRVLADGITKCAKRSRIWRRDGALVRLNYWHDRRSSLSDPISAHLP